MYLSFVITTRGDRDELSNAISSIVGANEIIVIKDVPRLEHVTRLNEGAKKAKGDFIMTMTDLTIMKDEWLYALWKAYEKIKYSGVVTFDENFCGTACISRDWYEEFGYFYHPDYIHYHGDQELGEVARKRLKYVEVPGKEMYKQMTPKKDLLQSQEFVVYDKTTYHMRTQKGYPKENVRTKEEREKELSKYIS